MTTLFGFLLLIAAVFGLFYPWIKKLYENHLRKKSYLSILNEINLLYQEDNPYELSLQARENNTSDLTYGEISLCALLDLLEQARPQKNDTFYDLGSGCGKTLFAVKLKYPTMRVKGIELLPVLHKLAKEKLQDYQQKHNFSSHIFDLDLICDNILNQSFSDANIIFINATAFTPATWEVILAKLVTLKPKTRVIITSKHLPESAFLKCYQGMEKMSWGLTSTYIYEKLAYNKET